MRPTVIQVQKILAFCKFRKIEPPYWARSNDDGEDNEQDALQKPQAVQRKARRTRKNVLA